jgi:hypothetical protein
MISFLTIASAAAVSIPSNLGLTKTGSVLTAPSTCPGTTAWGEGISTQGCVSCWFSEYSPSSTVVTTIPGLYPGAPAVEITVAQNTCKRVTFPCTLVPQFIRPGPRTIDIRHSYNLIDAAGIKTALGCPQKGGFPSGDVDFYSVQGLQTLPTYLVQTQDLGCKEFTCNKVSLLDVKSQRSIEVARILEKDDSFCSADGVCPTLRVIPSPNGKTLAVAIIDNNLRKQLKASQATGSSVSWSTFTGHHTVYFVDAVKLLNTEPIVSKTTQKIDSPPGSILNVEALRWSANGQLFGWSAQSEQDLTTFLFRANGLVAPAFGTCSGNATFLC